MLTRVLKDAFSLSSIAMQVHLTSYKSGKPAILTLIQHIPGQWDMDECNMEFTRRDSDTIEFEIKLPPQSKKKLVMQYHRRIVR